MPEHNDQALFAKLILDGAQAGLSWLTILRKRDNYFRAFDGLNPFKMARYDECRVQSLLSDAGIVRNRLKIEAAIANARAFVRLKDEGKSFDWYLWDFVDGVTRQNRWERLEDIPAKTRESERMSRALKQSGFSFVGPTICYAFMQAVGMVNDHVVTCFRHRELLRHVYEEG